MAWHQWDLSFGPVSGKAGTITTITQTPMVLFKGERVVAMDTGNPPGTATRIMQLFVGQRLQRPSASGSTLVAFFGAAAVGVGVSWDPCQPAYAISIQVSFIIDATFDLSVFGRASV